MSDWESLSKTTADWIKEHPDLTLVGTLQTHSPARSTLTSPAATRLTSPAPPSSVRSRASSRASSGTRSRSVNTFYGTTQTPSRLASPGPPSSVRSPASSRANSPSVFVDSLRASLLPLQSPDEDRGRSRTPVRGSVKQGTPRMGQASSQLHRAQEVSQIRRVRSPSADGIEIVIPNPRREHRVKSNEPAWSQIKHARR